MQPVAIAFTFRIIFHFYFLNFFFITGDEIVLTVEHLESAFIIFLFGLFASSFIFIMEIIVAQKWTQKILNSIWIKMQKKN